MSSNQSIFISWSGDRSRCVAEALHSWLPLVIEFPDYWISSRDLTGGRRWVLELSERLENCNFGILVLTPENSSSPWLIFEAGALSKSIQQGKVIPYLVSISKRVLTGPLGQFQALLANKEDTQRLVESIRTALPNPPEKAVIQKRFEMFWPEFEKPLAKIIEQPQQTSDEKPTSQEQQGDIAGLRSELVETTALIRQLVSNWTSTTTESTNALPQTAASELKLLEGAWFALENNSHLYAKVIKGQLVAPYCYFGNFELTAEFYDWKKIGDYWFTRYRWLGFTECGFAFYRLETPDMLVGMWWDVGDAPSDVSAFEDLDGKTRSRGIPIHWTRERSFRPPKWAQEYFKKVAKTGVQ